MTGHALHIGINYCGDRNNAGCRLDGPIPDARAFAAITAARGFQPLDGDAQGLLIEEKADAAGIVAAFEKVSKVQPGDTLVVTFSGFGATPDLSEAVIEPAWISRDLYRIVLRQVFDVLRSIDGAHILVVSAACFTGPQAAARAKALRALPLGLKKEIDWSEAVSLGTALSSIKSARDAAGSANATPSSSVIHISASGNDNTMDDGTNGNNSPFAAAMLALLKDGKQRSFTTFIKDLKGAVSPQPQLQRIKPFPKDDAFEKAGPFEIVKVASAGGMVVVPPEATRAA